MSDTQLAPILLLKRLHPKLSQTFKLSLQKKKKKKPTLTVPSGNVILPKKKKKIKSELSECEKSRVRVRVFWRYVLDGIGGERERGVR